MQYQIPLSNPAFNNLASRVAHPSRRNPTLEWDGSNIYMYNPTNFKTSKGLGVYIDKFCALSNHPKTYVDARQPYMQAQPQMPPHMMNWQVADPEKLQCKWPVPQQAPATPAMVLAYICEIDGPASMLLSPYNMDRALTPVAGYGAREPATEWRDVWYDADREDMQMRSIRLAPITVDYLYTVAVWWRIPAASVASYKRVQVPPIMRAAGVLEALGQGTLTHHDLRTESVQERRREYMRRWRENHTNN